MNSRKRRLESWADVEELVELREPETRELEFKQMLPQREGKFEKYELRKDAVAMANGGGGSIVFGIEDLDDRAASVRPLFELDRDVDRVRGTLAENIEPPLDYEVRPLRQDDQHGMRSGIIELIVGAGALRALEKEKGLPREFWTRRDTSVRAMSHLEISDSLRAPIVGHVPFGRGAGPLQHHLSALAIWEMRAIERPRSDVFREANPETFSRYFEQTLALASRSGEADEVVDEMGYLWETRITDAVRFGGYLRNFRAAADYFTALQTPDISDQVNPHGKRVFGRILELGFAFSYQANRRLKGAELLVALGAGLLGNALHYAELMGAPSAAAEARERLVSQSKFYKGELFDCFEYALALGAAARGPAYPLTPRLVEEAERGAPGETLFRMLRDTEEKQDSDSSRVPTA